MIEGFNTSQAASQPPPATPRPQAEVAQQQQQRTAQAYSNYQNPGSQDVGRTLESANRSLAFLNVELNIRIHEDTGVHIVSVVNRETGDVIRDVPPESQLDFLARIHEMIGIFVDVSA